MKIHGGCEIFAEIKSGSLTSYNIINDEPADKTDYYYSPF